MATNPVCLDDFERYAVSVLPRMALDYFRAGSNSEVTLSETRRSFDKLVLRPRILRDVSKMDLSTTVLGRKIPFPVGLAPTAMHGLAHPEGERATIRAAAGMDTCMIVSTLSTTRMEDIADAGGKDAHRWFQLYIYKDRELTKRLVRRAEKAGYAALVVTVDSPVWGQRLPDIRNKFQLPPHLRLMNFVEDEQARNVKAKDGSGLTDYVAFLFDNTVIWEDIKWLLSFSKLPILVKGILTGEDARIAADLGVSGIVVSNHGGRQLDCVPTSIEALPEVVRATAHHPNCQIFLDGGIRHGTDVMKALLLGARAVFIGRPVIWALTHSGEAGVRKMLEIIRKEFYVVMALMGATSISDLNPSMIARRDTLPKL